MDNKTSKNWFANWFDTPYYHILYQNRNDKEAEKFIGALTAALQIQENAKVLDLACGKGRHSRSLFQLGLDVTGVDLSAKSIRYARQFETEKLQFFVHDMREVFRSQYFDYVFNLFTSFGYFDTDDENFKVLSSASENLKKGGKFIIDFLNPIKAIPNLIPEEKKEEGGILFKITRQYQEGFIQKDIYFKDQQDYHFKEKVRAFRYEDFVFFFKRLNLKIMHVFGNYHLDNFDEQRADRMIFVVEK